MTTIYGLLTLDTWGDLPPNSNISVWRSSMFDYESDDLMVIIPVILTSADRFFLDGSAPLFSSSAQVAIDRATRSRRLISPRLQEWGEVKHLTPKVSVIRMPLYPTKLGARSWNTTRT